MIIKETDTLYGPDWKRFIFTGGLKRSDFDGEHVEAQRKGGHDCYLYQEPPGYDPAVNRLDGKVVPIPDTAYCTEGLIVLTDKEKTEIATQAVASHDDAQGHKREAEFNSQSYRALQGYEQRGEGDNPLQDLLDETDRIRAKYPYSWEVV